MKGETVMRSVAHRFALFAALCCCSLLLAAGMASPAGAGRTAPLGDSSLHGSLAPVNPAFLQSLASRAPSSLGVGKALGSRPGPQDLFPKGGETMPLAAAEIRALG